jgi:hypothetical protein
MKIRVTDIKDATGISKNETIIKYLKILMNENLISIDGKTILSKIKALELLKFTINDQYLNPTNFHAISTELFDNKIKTIGSNGWSLLCYLTKLHNYELGDISTSLGQSGYAYPTIEQIKCALNIGSNNTIINTLELLEETKLIAILKSNETISYIDAAGVTRQKKPNNKYIVHNKVPNSRYFLPINLPMYKKAMEGKSTT